MAQARQVWLCFERLKVLVGAKQHGLPRTMAALGTVQSSLSSELPRHKWRTWKRRLDPGAQKEVQNAKRRAVRAQAACTKAKQVLKNCTESKARGILTMDWLVRVCLASPIVSNRSLAKAFMDIAGQDKTVVSRFSITAIKDAFVTFYKEMHYEDIKNIVAEWLKALPKGGAESRHLFLGRHQVCDAPGRSRRKGCRHR